MTDITEMCAVMLAYENGAKIEWAWRWPSEGRRWCITANPLWDWNERVYRVTEFLDQGCDHDWQASEGGVYLCSRCGELWVDRGMQDKPANSYDWIEEAWASAAQCLRDSETSNTEMDTVLCEAVAKRIAFWMQTAAQNERNTAYYRGLLEECGEAIGEAAYIADDGGRSDSVLCAKIPELVKQLVAGKK
jgi:hypothetical protein